MPSIHRINPIIGAIPLLLATTFFAPGKAEEAPALRAVISADAAPEAMSQLYAPLGAGERTINVPGASWLQLQLSGVQLGPDGTLTITSSSGDTQTFSQTQIDAWQGLTAVFNGAELRVTMTAGAGGPVSARIADIIVGLPGSDTGAGPTGVRSAMPTPLRGLLGSDFERFLPADVRALRPRGINTESGSPPVQESICGATDDRVASADPRAGRIMPIGCTGWLIPSGAFLTAGHCATATAQTVEFNVPASQSNGATVAPPVRDQYRVVASSMVSRAGGVGADWATFRVLANTQTGQLPAQAQGGTFQISNVANPAQVTITGYGVDGPAPNFGAGGAARNAQNQTQQTHNGALSSNTGGATSGTLQYSVDTQGGNSGSPVIVAGSNVTVGIHTNGGCSAGGGVNAGTSFRNAELWAAINPSGLNWEALGGKFTSPPTVVAWGPNRLDIFGLGTDRQMYHKAWNGSSWSPSTAGWEPLGGIFTSPPAVVAWGTNRLDIFGLGTDRQMYHKAWGGSSWSPSTAGWEPLGGIFTSPPAVVAWGTNRLDIFGLGTDKQMYHKAWTGNAWSPSISGWEPLGGIFTSPPAVAAWGNNRLDIFGLGTDRQMFHKAWTGSAWSPSQAGWEALGGVFTSPPAVAAWGNNRLDVFGLGTDRQMFHKAWTGSAWSPSQAGWEALGGVFTSPPAVAAWGNNRLDIFGLGTDRQMFHKAWGGNAWSPSTAGWEPLGGVFTSPPAVAAWGSNRLDIFGLGTDDQMFHKAWNGSAWLP